MLSRLSTASRVYTRTARPIYSLRLRTFAKMATSATLERTDPAVVPNPLGEGKYIKTAGCIIIGDEVLNGKTKDTNSNFFAQFCFDLGIELKRIEVIADDQDEIVEAARRMTKAYDFVVTSGGIGPTHDDITYESLAVAFGLALEYHDDTKRRMWELSTPARREELASAPEAVRIARDRMALFPTQKGGHLVGSNDKDTSKSREATEGVTSEVIHVIGDKWVPVVRLGGKLCIFPGIPSLFQQLLLALTPYLPLPPASSKPFRHLIYTDMPESAIAPFLTELQARVKAEGIRIGSYPYLYSGVHVSLIGHDVDRIKALGEEVVKELKGKVVSSGTLGSEDTAAKI